jgi:hypothetical protein
LKIVLAVFQEEVKFSEGRIAPVDTYERGGLRGLRDRPFFIERPGWKPLLLRSGGKPDA